ncbi:MAG: RdgB/HAM1 family non-canonical purine NTP pyrophosphatase [Bacteroidales bacterium]|nr:RdgB/HAM1 family non-canonical purine NTP pyrophosphatase [Bacteroidales bacterium]
MMGENKKELLFATNNAHKLEEIQKMVPAGYLVKGLKEKGINEEIPEPYQTIEENAVAKAKYIFEKYNLTCFADDTGLEVEALDGAPGVYSARYAGDQCSAEDNIEKLLHELEGAENRKACFRTVIAYYAQGKTELFEGKVNGTITQSREGIKGFGYDPIFKPDNYTETFAEMELTEKNKISHRSRSLAKFIEFLKSSNI